MTRFLVLDVVGHDGVEPVAVNLDMVTCAHVVPGEEATTICLSGGHALKVVGIFETVMGLLRGEEDM